TPWRRWLPGCPNASMAPPSVPSRLTANDPILQSPWMVNTCAFADVAAARATNTAPAVTNLLTPDPFPRVTVSRQATEASGRRWYDRSKLSVELRQDEIERPLAL